MNNAELEAKVLFIVRTVCDGRPFEDRSVELKREWPDDPDRAARGIAGHANAAGFDDILWIVGLDQKAGKVISPDIDELSSWWPKVKAAFDGLAPGLQPLVVPTPRNGLVMALLFDTGRAPYVIRNPVFGKSGGGNIAYEVPWREGTSIRTARRSDLIELLVHTVAVPEIEVLAGTDWAEVRQASGSGGTGEVGFEAYITPKDADVVTIPYHRCAGEISLGASSYSLGNIKMFLATKTSTMIATEDELHVSGPGKVAIRVFFKSVEWPPAEVDQASVHLVLPVAKARAVAAVDFALANRPTGRSDWFKWGFRL